LILTIRTFFGNLRIIFFENYNKDFDYLGN
jgi:hypothetical protein